MDDVEVDAEKGTTTTMEVDAEKGTTTTMEPKKKTELLRSMDSSVLRFKNVDFAVGSNENKKLILDDVSGTVKWGRVLAVCLLCLLV
jgi:predicted metalloprotease